MPSTPRQQRHSKRRQPILFIGYILPIRQKFVTDALGFIAPFDTFTAEDVPEDPLAVQVQLWINKQGVYSIPWYFTVFPISDLQAAFWLCAAELCPGRKKHGAGAGKYRGADWKSEAAACLPKGTTVCKDLKKSGWLFLLPTAVAFFFAFAAPFCTGGKAFLYPVPDGDGRRVGRTGQNYVQAFTADSGFLHALWFTALFSGVSIITVNVLAFALALLLTRGLRGTNFFRGVFFMPNLIGRDCAGIYLEFAH